MKDYGIFGSSEDSTRIGDTVRGLVISLSAVIIFAAAHFNVALEQSQVVDLATALGGAVGAVWTLYGLIKKAIVKFS